MMLRTVQLDVPTKTLTFTGIIDHDNIKDLGAQFAAIIDANPVSHQWGADRHQWTLEFEGSRLCLNYEFYGDVFWLNSEDADEFEVIGYIHQLLEQRLCH